VNASYFRHIAEIYELKYVDPYNYQKIDFKAESRERLLLIFNESMKLRKLHPDCKITNIVMANILLVKSDYEGALPYTETAISRYPENADGYTLKAHALFGLGRFADAAAFYRTAIDRGLNSDVENVYRNLNTCYIRLKEYKKAYQVFAEFINPFNVNANYKDIYQLGVTAAAAGKLRDAINFLKIAEMKLPPDDAEYAKKIKDNLLLFDPETKKTSGQ
jgi:tetratricopeptide (TPR) repeat protein